MAFVVVFQNNKNIIAIQQKWVLDPILNAKTVIYFSPDNNDEPDFTTEPEYHFMWDAPHCYNARVIAQFGMFGLDFILLNFQDEFTDIYRQKFGFMNREHNLIS